MKPCRALLLLPLLLALALPATAQNRPDAQTPDGENNQVPATWIVRPDRANDALVVGADAEAADIFFVNMTPGWHITSGPAAIYYHPASTAQGAYRAETTIHLFPPGNRQREAYGLFIGGQGLDGEAWSYDYFLLRNTGEFLIKRRTGGETSTLKGWTAHDAILVHDNAPDATAKNVLAVEAGTDEVVFYINDAAVARFPRSEIHADGIVGLRFNHGLNVHISDLSVTPADG